MLQTIEVLIGLYYLARIGKFITENVVVPVAKTKIEDVEAVSQKSYSSVLDEALKEKGQ